MTTNTPNMALPYPDPTDTLQTVDDAIKALALALDGPSDAAAGLTGSGWSGTVTHTFRAGTVSLIFNASKGSWAAGETITTLPVGFRPAVGTYALLVTANTAQAHAVLIANTGVVTSVLAGSSLGGLLGVVSYAA